MIENILGKNIRRLRIKNKMTQNDLSKKMNKAESTVRMWELGRSEPDKDSIVLLSEIFDVTTDYLLGKVEIKDEKKDGSEIKIDDFQFALYGEVKDLTDEQKQDLLEMVKLFKKQSK